MEGGLGLAWKFADGKAIYLQIMEYILMDILSGKYEMGQKIPSVRDLALEAAVNPNTMQKALSEMETYGLISAQRTAGRFVTTDREAIERATEAMAKNFTESYTNNMRKLGYGHEEMAAIIRNLSTESAEKEQNAATDRKTD